LTTIGLKLDMGRANIYYIYPKPNNLTLIKPILILLIPYKSMAFMG
jgi:hypothetical protein